MIRDRKKKPKDPKHVEQIKQMTRPDRSRGRAVASNSGISNWLIDFCCLDLLLLG